MRWERRKHRKGYKAYMRYWQGMNTKNGMEMAGGGESTGRKGRVWRKARRLLLLGVQKEPGIDGILVTVGLCIIALLLCVVMKDSLQSFIETIVAAMTTEAQKILTGVSS